MPKSVIVLVLIAYLLAVNLLGFYLMGSDKKKAKEGRWRTREVTFFAVSLLAGGVGTLAGMYVFRHKTKHMSFLVGIPLCMVAGLAAYAGIFYALMKFIV